MKSSLLGLESYPYQLVQEVERCFGSVTSIDVYCDGVVRINTMDNAALKAYREAYGETALTETHGIRVLFGAECREWTVSNPPERENLDLVFPCHIGLG